MTEKQEKCVYCNENKCTTNDHVPPKSFFPKPRPSNLITVPSCLECNQGLGKDEEFFLATFMFSQVGVSDAGKRLWLEKLSRMYEKNLGLRKKIAQHLESLSLQTTSGIYLGNTMTINTDEKRLEMVVNKILKGLYFFEYNMPFPDNAEITTLYLNHEDKYTAAEETASDLKLGSRIWDGIFEYRFNRLPDNPAGSMWLFRF